MSSCQQQASTMRRAYDDPGMPCGEVDGRFERLAAHVVPIAIICVSRTERDSVFTGTAKATDTHVEGALFLKHVARARGLVVEDDVGADRLHERHLLV